MSFSTYRPAVPMTERIVANEGVELSRVNGDDLIASYIDRTRTDDTTNVGRFLGDVALRQLKAQYDTTNGDFQKLNVGFHMTPEEKNALKSNFPGLEIVFKDSTSSSHSYAAAHRICETLDIYNRFQTKSEKIIDLGGNYVSHSKQKRTNVHSCCPILDVRDGARHMDRYISLAGAVERHHRELPVDFCCHKFEECQVQAPFAMAIHSVSDIPITTVAAHCMRRGVRKLIASVMMDPLMMLYNSGHIPLLNVDWEKEDVDGKTLIHFHFVDAPGLSYTHNFDVLCQYMTSNQVIVNNQYSYRVERTSNLSGVYIVELTLAMTDGVSLAHIRPMRDLSCAWLSALRKKVFVKLAIPAALHDWYNTPFEIRWAALDEQLVRYVSEAAFRQYSKTKDAEVLVQYIATMLSSSSNHVVINGITMRSGSPVNFEEYVPLAVTFYALAKFRYDSINAGIKAVKTVVPKETDRIDLSGRLTTGENMSFLETVGLRMFRGKEIEKTNDNSYLVRDRNIFREIVNDVMVTFGLKLVGEADDYLSGVPSHLKATDVWQAFLKNSDLPACINVEQCVDDLLSKHKESIAQIDAAEAKEKEFKDARDRALMKIATVIDKDPTMKDGLMPILDLCKVREELEAASSSIALTPDSVMRSDNRLSSDTQPGSVNPYADSIKEAIQYFNEVEVVNTRKLKSLGQYLSWSVPKSPEAYRALAGRDESVQVFEPMRNKWFGNLRPVPEYERAMTEDGYVSLQWQDGQLSPTCLKSIRQFAVILVNDSCVFNAGQRMVPALEAALRVVPQFKVTIIDGVAGCGKTTYLKRESRMDTASPDLILTSNRSSADELKETVQCQEAMKYRIRTVDSYLMLKKWFSADRMLFDECFLTHAGCVYAAATLAQVKEVIALGDTEQVPFISRLPEFRMEFNKIQGEIKTQEVTYRCPRDATACLKKFFYKNKSVKTASMVERSLTLEPIVSVVQVPDEPNTLYLTHTRADKEALVRAPGFKNKMNVKTTHEAQGDTWDNVILFRLSKTTTLLHSGKNPNMGSCHNLVAVSRHRKSLRYYTVAPNDYDDQIVKAVNYAVGLDRHALDDVRIIK